ncbi:MAG TPA: class I SAM-dependent methyltransferase [Candidatus Aphodomonas merdavium]|nr:class I SAM-dependent methyltransferase [Candidatus Aphodomonas merdavium]
MSGVYDEDGFFFAYAQMDRSQKGLAGAAEWGQLRQLLPQMRGKDVLDLGCGYGWHCRYAAEQGARSVLGIDCSERMLAQARRRNGGGQITYRACALEQFPFPEQAYDLILSNLVLHYVEDLDSLFARVFAALRPKGVFVFNIEHPVFTAGVGQEWVLDAQGKALYWPVDDYFYPGERTTHFLGHTVKKQHHTLTQLLMGLLSQGFRLEAVVEAQPPEALLAQAGMRDEMRRPMMLLVRAVKP